MVPDEIDIQDMRVVTPFHGPALGIGISLPLNDRVFFSANTSVLYMVGAFDSKKNVRYQDEDSGAGLDGFIRVTDQMPKTRMEQFGLNVEPAIGFNPGDGLPIISLGLRFQWLRVHFTETEQEMPGPDDWMDDYLYGIFISAVYVF